MLQLYALTHELGVDDQDFLAGRKPHMDAPGVHFRVHLQFCGFSQRRQLGPCDRSAGCFLRLRRRPSKMIADSWNGFPVPVFDYAQFEQKLRLSMVDGGLPERLATNARPGVARFSVDRICSAVL